GLSEPPGFTPSTGYRPPKWNKPEGFSWKQPVDWKRYWKWKGSDLLPTVVKRKRKWWIRWGKWDRLSGTVEMNGFTKPKQNNHRHGFKPMQAVLPMTPKTSTHTSKDTSNAPAFAMIKQSAPNNHGFQVGSPQIGRVA
ncbi:MAG: hypothetical protein GY940_43005, partial [bacterium]|nr:hypothetical protein [bacterium]